MVIKSEVKAPSVYRSGRILKYIDDAITTLVDKGTYTSYNAALNGLLKKQLKVKGKKYLTLKQLKTGDKFKFASSGAFRTCVVLEHCVTDKKKKYNTRKCKIVETNQVIYPSCTKAIIKL